MLRLILAAGVAGLLATAALAQPQPSSTEAADEPAPATAVQEADDYDPMKVVCRKVRPPTGTRLITGQTRQTMCMSNADWEQQQLDAQDALGERDKGICAGSSCGG